MGTQVNDGFATLTEKEKQTLRLIVRGHDAKSIARSLDLSVHTINERLRAARRKLAVSSSREAARLLLQAEGADPARPTDNSDGYNEIGEDPVPSAGDQQTAPVGGARARRLRPVTIGVLLMTFALALLALATLVPAGSTQAPPPTAEQEAPDAEVVSTAQAFLVLLDQGRWDESYRAFGAAFRGLNSLESWAAVSDDVRAPLGQAISRTFLSQENVPTPPQGVEMVKFRTRFADGETRTETVTLNRENGGWYVVGVMID
ncbi:helix-turn-helix domain-containing protein [Croceibacterium ferulae]|uniref:helix-turn-helix domain-containing protein n=1 Tax=Croceibacterium ferulae TaxID=1854641 RepID=UPI000EB19DA8|nr:DUF4019 domain-containing protein [Croceibacterium ferulae]